MSANFFILTMGCQMNKNDSERIAGLLQSAGMVQSFEATEADILIINTCSVRQPAEDRIYGIVKNWQEIKNKNPKALIAVTGCMPGRDREGKLRRKLPGVDLYFEIDKLPQLPRWIKELNPELPVNDAFSRAGDYLALEPIRPNFPQAFITIQTGCNNFCSYCIVPHARGRERNRPVKDVMDEVRRFAEGGGLALTLLGQVVNHYIAPDQENFSADNPYLRQDDFAALLWEINRVPGLCRVHFMASDPQYFSDFQIEALKLPKLMNYIHLPAQSGDNDILKKMNRKYGREQYIDLVKKIRKVRPDIALGTDLIVGFCGENEERFHNTLNFYGECVFDIAYTAMYSPRPGTAAAKILNDDVPREVIKRRWEELQSMMEKKTFEKNQRYVGKTVEVLVENCQSGICSGNSREMKLVQFLGASELIGKIVSVKIFEAMEWLLKGDLI